MKIVVGIDLLWYKPKKVAGIGSFIKNLLHGIQYATLSKHFHFILYCSRNNFTEIRNMYNTDLFTIVECSLNNENSGYRQIWKNIKFYSKVRENKIDLMFFPTYELPFNWNSKLIPTCVVIHDLQALHYPEYHNIIKEKWLKISWRNTTSNSTKVVVISKFVKRDILKNFSISSSKIKVIYNPIVVNTEQSIETRNKILQEYDITSGSYLYSLSTMHPHKNFETLYKALKKLDTVGSKIPKQFVLTGIIHNKNNNEIKNLENLNNFNVKFTGYISEIERDILISNASVLLFPSIFEGFGMPVIEALMLGTRVIASDIEVLREIANSEIIYVKNPKNPDSWKLVIENFFNNHITSTLTKKDEFEKFKPNNVAEKYLKLFCETVKDV